MTHAEQTEHAAATYRHIVAAIVTDAGGQPSNWRETVAKVLDKLGPELEQIKAKQPPLFEEAQS